MNWLLMVLISVAACVVAWVLMQRMFDAQQKLAQLHDELKRNDLKLENERQRLNDQLSTQPDTKADNQETLK